MNTRIIGLDRASAKIQAMGNILGKDLPDLVKREARLVAVSFAKSSVPFDLARNSPLDANYTGAAALKIGKIATERDIRKVFATPGKAYADIRYRKAQIAFWKAFKAGDIHGAQIILDEFGNALRGVPIGRVDPEIHRSVRDGTTGRVILKRPLVIARVPEALKLYIASRQKNVGTGKSGWAAAARAIGGIRGLKTEGDISASWILGRDGEGDAQINSSDPLKPSVRISSHVTYASQILQSGAQKYAIEQAHGRLIKNLQIAIAAESRRLTRAA